MSTSRRGQAGFTLVEVLVASVIASVVAGGTMASYVAASRMMRAQSNPASAEAAGYAQDTVERFRNSVACDNAAWFTPATCTMALPAGWQVDALPGAGGTDSILNTGARRCVRFTPQDCDGVGGADDCIQVDVQVCWNGAACPC